MNEKGNGRTRAEGDLGMDLLTFIFLELKLLRVRFGLFCVVMFDPVV